MSIFTTEFTIKAEAKKKIMRNLGNLRASDRNISMNHDMTKEEREMTKNLIKKAKDMNEQEKSGEWHFIVRGPPWDKEILKVRNASK